MSSEKSNLNDPDVEVFEQTLVDVERSLLELKERYTEIQQNQQLQTQLQQQLEAVEAEGKESHLPELERQLQGIKAQLEELAMDLESALLSENDLRQLFWEGLRRGLLGEVFWQIVRFGGLGVVIGWILKSCQTNS